LKDGVDCRNYGGLEGLNALREFFAKLLEVDTKNVVIGGTSSLTLMFDYLSQAMLSGVLKNTPWSKLDHVKFLCPAPGYDRHFAFLEYFGIEMITVPMNEDGPDLDVFREYIKDDHVKGMFCVTKYSYLSVTIYSDDIVIC